MTELQKWNLVNDATSFELLHQAICDISDVEGNIASSTSGWHYQAMQERLGKVHHDGTDPTILTRAYGIRRQAMALLAGYNLHFHPIKNDLLGNRG